MGLKYAPLDILIRLVGKYPDRSLSYSLLGEMGGKSIYTPTLTQKAEQYLLNHEALSRAIAPSSPEQLVKTSMDLILQGRVSSHCGILLFPDGVNPIAVVCEFDGTWKLLANSPGLCLPFMLNKQIRTVCTQLAAMKPKGESSMLILSPEEVEDEVSKRLRLEISDGQD